MIVYQATKSQFIHDTFQDDIEHVLSQQYLRTTGRTPAPAEFNAWKHSLFEVGEVLKDPHIPDDMGVALEYTVPQTSKRIDVLLTGADETGTPKLVIIELKQWSEARFSEKDGIIWARRGGKAAETEGPHPSYQAWSYAALLNDFNTAVYEGGVALQPCAYLHNYARRDGVIDHPAYAPHMQRAPLFLKKEADDLRAFIRQHVKHGDKRNLLYLIEHGKIRPSKMLADSIAGMLQGKPEFVLVDDQKLVFETVLQVDRKAHEGARPRKQVVIVQGGPGTGKTVVAVNLLAALLKRQRNARYVSKNAAPREVYAAKLTGTFRKSHIHNLFSGSGAFTQSPAGEFDTLIVDEAHRLNEKSGLYGNLGENQVKEVINASRCTVFFVDDDQRVTLADIGHSDALRQWAQQLGADVTELALASQFRCSGSDGYLAWLDDVLDIRPTANADLRPELQAGTYDFRVLDTPTELHALIEQKSRQSNRARVVAGYCWGWPSKKDPQAFDIDMPEHGYRRQWNLTQDGSLWIMAPESVAQVGCIHTCQGLEVDHVGVIIGPDLVLRDGRIQTNPKARARSDKSIKGLSTLMKRDPQAAQALADRIIKNTYRTLMTRGMKGCYVWCADPALAAYLRQRMGTAPQAPRPSAQVLPLRRVSPQERAQGVPAVPVVELKFAAGHFSEPQALEDGATDWVELPEWVKPQPGLFVAQVVGESMNRRIPNGAWCLFRANPQGTRNGKIVVVQHRSISDPETGGSYTIKRYRSEKVLDEDGGWRHERIELVPESDVAGYQTIQISAGDADDEVVVAAEWLMELS